MANITIQYTADISNLNNGLSEIIKKQEQASSSAKKLGDDLSDAAKKAKSETDRLDTSINKLTAAITSAFAVSKVVEFTRGLIDAEKKMELLQNRLNFLSGSTASGEQMFTRLEATSRRLGLSIEDTAEGMASFGIAAQQAGFSAQKSEKLFIQVASGLRAAGASSLQTQRAFYALQQMMSKGVVAAEELRRQLGESLPGASDLMTKAYNKLHPAANLTNLEFTKLLESGKIISKDILPEFANVIEETFAPALSGKTNSLDAVLNRVNNEILKLKLNIGNADWFKAAAGVINTSLFELNAVLSSESLSTLDKIYASLFVGDPEKSKKTVGAFDMIQTAVDEYNNKVSQAITTNKVFGDALEQRSKSYGDLSKKERDSTKQSLEAEFEKNKLLISDADKMSAFERIRRDKEITDAKSKNEFLSALRIEYYNLDQELSSKEQKDKDEAEKIKNQFLIDEVARAEMRVLATEKGSIEENVARANLAEKQKNLNEFMAKSDATMQLERVKGEIKANEEIEEARIKTADALSQGVVEDEIDPSKDPNLKAIDKTLETYRKNKDKISEAIAAPFMDATQKEMVEATNRYLELIKLTEENSEERKQLEEALQKELDNIRQRSAEKEAKSLEQKVKNYARAAAQIVGQASSLITGYADAERKMRENAMTAELQSLSARFEAGVMGEEEYQKRVNEIKKQQFIIDQEAAISKIKMDTAVAIINLFAQLPFPAAALLVAPVAGLGLAQIDAVKSTPMPTFHDGGIDIGGNAKMTSGPLRSDEFIAKLQKGESVMTANETSKYKDVLSAIRKDKLPGLIAEKYIIPAYKDSMNDVKRKNSSQSTMELAFQTAELVSAIKNNKRIKIDNVKELSRAMNKNSTLEQVVRRRSW
jgi:tape measure domain-containing protein